MAAELPQDDPRLRELADRLDCLTECDLVLLADVAPGTAKSWRERGTGPAYVIAGNRTLYPRAAVAEWLAGRVRERNHESRGTL
jgi:hypothetical protein